MSGIRKRFGQIAQIKGQISYKSHKSTITDLVSCESKTFDESRYKVNQRDKKVVAKVTSSNTLSPSVSIVIILCAR